jgi:hypothetical protein
MAGLEVMVDAKNSEAINLPAPVACPQVPLTREQGFARAMDIFGKPAINKNSRPCPVSLRFIPNASMWKDSTRPG